MLNPFDDDAADDLPRHLLLGLDEGRFYGEDDEPEPLDLGDIEPPRYRRLGRDVGVVHAED